VPILIIYYIAVFRTKKKILSNFANPELLEKILVSFSFGRQRLKATLIILAVISIIIAIARPQIGTKLVEMKSEGQDIIVILDISKSMNAEDIKPSRLIKAKHEVKKLVDMLQGDRVGLLIFAGVPFLQCPLTLDYDAFKMFLDYVDTNTIPVPGTAIADAIDLAIRSFKGTEKKHKVIILITDGEDHEGQVEDIAKKASNEGIKIYTVGIGETKGEPIPDYDERGNKQGYKKSREASIIMSRLNQVLLEKIALATSGKYYQATPNEMELEKIYEDILKMEKTTTKSKKYSQYEDRFQYFLAFAGLMLILEMLISERKRKPIFLKEKME
jgi:Ca-activated chloride channel family protein